VTFTGFRDDVPRLLNGLDIFVFPSYAEAYGLALLEAMAVKLPVVASDCDGVLDIVVDGKTGILVPARESQPLTLAVEELIQNGKKREQLREAGYDHFRKHFTAARMIEKIENLYFQL
jgi:glycosyltransferase involved in cell wall biosynthesis